jgi:predicted acylesterase/phospholipase RssA
MQLADGGVIDSLATHVAFEQRADKIIAVDVYPELENLHEERLAAHPPDVLLRPAVESYASLDFKDVRGPLLAGAAETERHLPAIKALVAQPDFG